MHFPFSYMYDFSMFLFLHESSFIWNNAHFQTDL